MIVVKVAEDVMLTCLLVDLDHAVITVKSIAYVSSVFVQCTVNIRSLVEVSIIRAFPSSPEAAQPEQLS